MLSKLVLVALAGCTNLLGSAAPTSQYPNPEQQYPVTLNEDDSFNFEILLPLGAAPFGGADIAEVIAAAQVIKPGDISSYNQTFYDLATATQAMADGYTNPKIAQGPYFRAANYFRAAVFYLLADWNYSWIDKYWDLQTNCFDKAIASLPVPGYRVSLPADGFETIGIYFGVDAANATDAPKRPTLLLGNGYDGWQEDSYHWVARSFLDQGWNVMVYEGPGQATVRRKQNLGFIYDWEKVVTPAVDYLYSLPDVDTSRIALMGISLGGYLAARAAAFEPRINALILDGGVWDTHAAFLSYLGPAGAKLYHEGNATLFDEVIYSHILNNATYHNTGSLWALRQGLWSFNTHSPYDWLQQSRNFTLAGGVAERINCPTWIADAQHDNFFGGQQQIVAKAIGAKATIQKFTGPASYHCQPGAFLETNEKILTWLETALPAATTA